MVVVRSWLSAILMFASFSASALADDKIDFELPAGDEGQIRQFVARMREAQKLGSSKVPSAEVFQFFPLSDDERKVVLNSRPEPVHVQCSGDICTAVSRGNEVQTRMSQVNIPGLGNPKIWLGRVVTVYIKVYNEKSFEICRTSNIQVQKVFWMNLDGAWVTPDGGGFIDVGSGGTYPNC